MCDWRNCRSPSEIGYAAVRPAFELCDAHWEKFCELEGAAKMKAIYRIVPNAVAVSSPLREESVSKAPVEKAPRKVEPKRTERSPARCGTTQLLMFN